MGTHASVAPMQEGMVFRESTALANQVRDAFVAEVLAILGSTAVLWLPRTSEASTSTTDRTLNAATGTYNAASVYVAYGSGVGKTFNGTTTTLTFPNSTLFQFGDGVNDYAFSGGVLFKPTISGSTARNIMGRYDLTSGLTKLEWRFYLDINSVVNIQLVDDSATAATIGRSISTALTTAVSTLLTWTYDGSKASTGLRIYKDGARADDTTQSSGTYVAMEAFNQALRVGFHISSVPDNTNFMQADAMLAFLTQKALSQHENKALALSVNSFSGLSL